MTASNVRAYVDRDTFNTGNPVVYRPGVGLVNVENGRPLLAALLSTLKHSGKQIGRGTVGIHAPEQMADKNYVSDLEFSEYFDGNNLIELGKNLLTNFAQNYAKVAVSQPLEMVRLVLQVGLFAAAPQDITAPMFDDDDEPVNYFQLTNEWSDPSATLALPDPTETPTPKVTNNDKIHPKLVHTLDIINALTTLEGPFALFKGINASFIYNTVLHTVEAWITGFLLPFLGIPDPYFLDLTHSNDPVRLLCLSVLACVITGLVLMPLDLVRVRLMVTKFNRREQQYPQINARLVRELLRNYPQAVLTRPPASIAFFTTLHLLATLVFRKMAPYMLYIKFNVDLFTLPTVYTVVNFALLVAEFFVKLPLENMLRKSQVRFLVTPKTLEEDPMRVVTIDDPEDNLIVEFNDLYAQPDLTLAEKVRRMELFRGWRVGLLNVVGFWGYNIFKDSAVELREERL